MREVGVEPHQKLEVFLPKLLTALERRGVSEAAVVLTCKSLMAGGKQPPIKTVEHYQVAWTACDAAADILTTLDDSSDGAVWCRALARRIFDFEADYVALHGHAPLNPGGPEATDGPAGTA
jgi:hypothetical protein